jgi:tripartite-type tricarboxylate transporter receptor subunit TctC
LLKDVPTFAELGVTGFNMSAFHTATAPKGTSPEVLRILTQGFLKAANSEEYRVIIEKSGMIPVALGREESLAFLQRQESLYNSVLGQ